MITNKNRCAFIILLVLLSTLILTVSGFAQTEDLPQAAETAQVEDMPQATETASATDMPQAAEAAQNSYIFPDSTEPRNIYIGDIITLKITSTRLTAEELSEKFQGFEIKEIKAESDGFLLSLRTFNAGEYKVLVGNKEIIIDVKSTLDDFRYEGIFEGETNVIEPGILFHWRILFYVAAGIFVLLGFFALLRALIKRRIKALDPYKLFIRSSGSLSEEDDDYFVNLTFFFKEYLEGLHKFRIIGKTSTEIVNAIKNIPALESALPEIKEWLTECDRLKFTGVEVSKEKKREHYGQLLKLAEKIDLRKPN